MSEEKIWDFMDKTAKDVAAMPSWVKGNSSERTSIPCDAQGRPRRHWAGRVEAAKVLRAWVNETHPEHLTVDEATDITDRILAAYTQEMDRCRTTNGGATRTIPR